MLYIALGCFEFPLGWLDLVCCWWDYCWNHTILNFCCTLQLLSSVCHYVGPQMVLLTVTTWLLAHVTWNCRSPATTQEECNYLLICHTWAVSCVMFAVIELHRLSDFLTTFLQECSASRTSRMLKVTSACMGLSLKMFK